MNDHAVLIVHLFATAAMTGVIWIVQLVHYPTFRFIPAPRFSEFESFHCNQISLVVIPLMVVELLSGFYLLYLGERSLVFLTALAVLIVIWLATALIQAPIHNGLMQGENSELIVRLVRSNWIRTSGWTARSLLLLSLFAPVNSP